MLPIFVCKSFGSIGPLFLLLTGAAGSDLPHRPPAVPHFQPPPYPGSVPVTRLEYQLPLSTAYLPYSPASSGNSSTAQTATLHREARARATLDWLDRELEKQAALGHQTQITRSLSKIVSRNRELFCFFKDVKQRGGVESCGFTGKEGGTREEKGCFGEGRWGVSNE